MHSQDKIREFIIAAHGDLEKVQMLLNEHPDLLHTAFEWQPDDLENALQAASHMGNRAIAEYVLSLGIPLNVYAAAMLGRADEVRRFLSEDSSLASKPGVHGFSLLWHAALSGDTSIAQTILDHGGQNESHNLHAAVSQGHLDMVNWLLNHGASNVLVKNYQDKTPIEVAEAGGYTEIAALLRKHAPPS